ncbi:MAG: glycosyltransferase family 39 protein [Myxococcales bacterium]|nr:glycosyltransferase family 39 protein [Myxococcales bacterium]
MSLLMRAWGWRRARVYHALALVLVLGFAAGLRLRELGELSVWLDEAITWQRSTLAVPALVRDCVARNHTPTYFLFMHYWLQLGDDEFMLRLPSVLFGLLKVMATCALGWVTGGARVGLFGGLLVALMPQQLRYDQEARMYALFVFATTTALAALVWLLRHPEARAVPPLGTSPLGPAQQRSGRVAWGILIGGTALALYAHNTAVFFVATTSAAALVALAAQPTARAGFARNWALSQLVVLLLWAPWVGSFLRQARHVHGRFWARFPEPPEIQDTLADLYLFGADEPWMLALCLALTVAGTWGLRNRPVVLVGLWLQVLMTPALVLLVSLERPMFLLRVMLWAGVPFAVIMAGVACAVRAPALLAGMCLVVASAGFVNLERHYYGSGRKPNWRAALTNIVEHRGRRSLVLLAGGREIRQVRYYLERRTGPLPSFPYADVTRPGVFEGAFERALGTRDVWVVHRKTRTRTDEVLEGLRRHGRQRMVKRYGRGLTVRLFRMRRKST